MGMYPATLGNIGLGVADAEAIFDDRCALLDVGQGNLVPPLYFVEENDLNALHRLDAPLGDIGEGDGHIVAGIDADKLHINCTPSFKIRGTGAPGPRMRCQQTLISRFRRWRSSCRFSES